MVKLFKQRNLPNGRGRDTLVLCFKLDAFESNNLAVGLCDGFEDSSVCPFANFLEHRVAFKRRNFPIHGDSHYAVSEWGGCVEMKGTHVHTPKIVCVNYTSRTTVGGKPDSFLVIGFIKTKECVIHNVDYNHYAATVKDAKCPCES